MEQSTGPLVNDNRLLQELKKYSKYSVEELPESIYSKYMDILTYIDILKASPDYHAFYLTYRNIFQNTNYERNTLGYSLFKVIDEPKVCGNLGLSCEYSIYWIKERNNKVTLEKLVHKNGTNSVILYSNDEHFNGISQNHIDRLKAEGYKYAKVVNYSSKNDMYFDKTVKKNSLGFTKIDNLLQKGKPRSKSGSSFKGIFLVLLFIIVMFLILRS